jgi:hypothetical protein
MKNKHKEFFMKKIIIPVLALLLSFASVRGVQAYSYTAWGTMTGAKTLALNPFFYGPLEGDFALNADLAILYGFTPTFDIIANLASLTVTPDFGYAGSYIMPRIDLGKNNIIGVQLGMDSSFAPYNVVPQYHFFIENGKAAFELNVSANIPFSAPDSTILGAVVAPVYKFVPGKFHAFVEIDPSYTLGGSFALNVVPGIWLGLAEGKHQFCLSAPLTGVTSSDGMGVTFGAWYWTTFTL